jgi:Asp-tRNA(Asn)/Glu-tRNA(Gln) amidotransferase C subunit
MDLQTRKLNVIEYIAGLKDESIFSKIEFTILENKVRNDQKLKPFTQKQLLSRAKRSNEDYKAEKYKSLEVLERESESW